MTDLQIDDPSKDLSQLYFVPKDSDRPNVRFSGSTSSPYYVGPIEVTTEGVNHGLGVISSRDIEAGECLFVIGPAVSVNMKEAFDEWKRRYTSGSLNMNDANDTAAAKTSQQPKTLLESVCEDFLVKTMRQTLLSNDDKNRVAAQSILMQLNDATRNDMVVPQSPAERLALLVGAPLPPSSPMPSVDLSDDKLLEIIRRNAFGPDFTMYESVEEQWKDQLDQQNSRSGDTVSSSYLPSRLLGLYPLAAMLNHSCVPNALRVFCAGDWMVVHASAKITKGDEVVWSYLPPILPYPQRYQQLSERHGFVCGCVRCNKEQEVDTTDDAIFSVPQSLRLLDSLENVAAVFGSLERRRQFTQDLIDWEKQVTTSLSNELKRYWKIGNANLFIHHLNAVLMNISNSTPATEADTIRASVLMAAMDLHFCFVACDYACTEHLSVMHLCYELVAIMHAHSADQTKTLGKVQFWTEQLKRCHLTRYGALGDDVNRVRMIMKHTQQVLRNKRGREMVNYDFI